MLSDEAKAVRKGGKAARRLAGAGGAHENTAAVGKGAGGYGEVVAGAEMETDAAAAGEQQQPAAPIDVGMSVDVATDVAAVGVVDLTGEDSPVGEPADSEPAPLCPVGAVFSLLLRTTLKCKSCGRCSSACETASHLSLNFPAAPAPRFGSGTSPATRSGSVASIGNGGVPRVWDAARGVPDADDSDANFPSRGTSASRPAPGAARELSLHHHSHHLRASAPADILAARPLPLADAHITVDSPDDILLDAAAGEFGAVGGPGFVSTSGEGIDAERFISAEEVALASAALEDYDAGGVSAAPAGDSGGASAVLAVLGAADASACGNKRQPGAVGASAGDASAASGSASRPNAAPPFSSSRIPQQLHPSTLRLATAAANEAAATAAGVGGARGGLFGGAPNDDGSDHAHSVASTVAASVAADSTAGSIAGDSQPHSQPLSQPEPHSPPETMEEDPAASAMVGAAEEGEDPAAEKEASAIDSTHGVPTASPRAASPLATGDAHGSAAAQRSDAEPPPPSPDGSSGGCAGSVSAWGGGGAGEGGYADGGSCGRGYGGDDGGGDYGGGGCDAHGSKAQPSGLMTPPHRPSPLRRQGSSSFWPEKCTWADESRNQSTGPHFLSRFENCPRYHDTQRDGASGFDWGSPDDKCPDLMDLSAITSDVSEAPKRTGSMNSLYNFVVYCKSIGTGRSAPKRRNSLFVLMRTLSSFFTRLRCAC